MHLGIIKIVYNRTAQPKCSNCATHFMDNSFVNPGEYKAGLHKCYFKKWVNSDFAMTIWRFWISHCKYVLLLVKYLLLTVQMWSFARRVCEWVWERERETGSHISVESAFFIAACVLRIHSSIIINVSVTWLCSPLGLELMVKLRTLLTIFTFILKLKLAIMEGGVTFPTRACGVRPITMHGQLANQSRPLVRRRGFVENYMFERGGA